MGKGMEREIREKKGVNSRRTATTRQRCWWRGTICQKSIFFRDKTLSK